MVAERDGDVDCFVVRLIGDFELETFEQRPQLALGQIGEPVGEERQPVEERRHLGEHGRLCGGLIGERAETLPALGDRVLKLGNAFCDPTTKARRDLVGFKVEDLFVEASFEVGDIGLDLRSTDRRGCSLAGLVGDSKAVLPVAEALGTKERCSEEVEQRAVQACLVQVDVLRMAVRDVLRALMGWLAGVVGRGASVVAPHPQPADAAVQQPAIEIVRARRRARLGGRYELTRSRVRLRAQLHRFVLLAADDRRVRDLVGPDPRLGRVRPVATRFACSAVPDLIAGVLRVGEHLADARPAPVTEGGSGVDRDRWRIAVEIRVHPVADLQQADASGEIPVIDRAHDRGAGWVECQGVLLVAAARLVRVRVVVVDEAVAEEGDASGVPALARRSLEALARLHHQLVVIAARDADVHVSQHDRAEGLFDWLVCRAEPDTRLAQLVLDSERDRGVAAQSTDRLDDDAIEVRRTTLRITE